MGYLSDLGTGTVARVCPTTGYPVDNHGHLLDPLSPNDGRPVEGWDRAGTKLCNVTSPYGHLEFAIGTGDDFTCFDYEEVNAGPRGRFIVLHSVWNSEAGGYIHDVEYRVLPCNSLAEKAAAVREAIGLMDRALETLSFNELRHSAAGWNQSPEYFPIAVARCLFPYRFERHLKDGRKAQLNIRRNNRAAWRITTEIAFPKALEPAA